jgi:probable HAF family extracellular repeat protein
MRGLRTKGQHRYYRQRIAHPETTPALEGLERRVLLAAQYTVLKLATPDALSGYALDINDSGQALVNLSFGINPRGNELAAAFRWSEGTLTKLGSLGGSTYGAEINNNGDVTGYSYSDDTFFRPHAFLWSQGGMSDLGTLGGRVSGGYGLNDLGQVVGSSRQGV